MTETEKIGCLEKVRRFLIHSNIFETDDIDERTIHIQRWSTKVYICVIFICMCVLTIQHGLYVDTQLIEVKNPSLESYIKLRNIYPDINCPCSQISISCQLFATLTPVFHPICSSEFILQTWIEMLVDNMTSFRFPGDFRATASTQFQTLRGLCSFAQTSVNNAIQSFFEQEFISGTLWNEDRWRIEIGAIINEFLNSTFADVQQKISFIRSFVIYNLLVSAIQTPTSLLIDDENDALVINSELNSFIASAIDSYCTCGTDNTCYFPSSFYNATMVNNEAYIAYWILQSQLSLVLNKWFVGCWALESLFLSSFNSSFLYNQTELDLIATYFNWSSDVKLPTALNLTESNNTNSTSGILDDLIETSFVENMLTKLNYSIYFEQCQAKSCFYSIQKHSDFLYIVTSLLALYGGLSIALQFLIPYIVAFLIERLTHRVATSVNDGESEPISFEGVKKTFVPKNFI
jgi:hypothetical protein